MDRGKNRPRQKQIQKQKKERSNKHRHIQEKTATEKDMGKVYIQIFTTRGLNWIQDLDQPGIKKGRNRIKGEAGVYIYHKKSLAKIGNIAPHKSSLIFFPSRFPIPFLSATHFKDHSVIIFLFPM